MHQTCWGHKCRAPDLLSIVYSIPNTKKIVAIPKFVIPHCNPPHVSATFSHLQADCRHEVFLFFGLVQLCAVILRSRDRAASWHVTVLHRDMWPCCIVTNFFIIKPTGCTNFTNLFCQKLYMFRAVSLPIIRSFPLYIRHWYMSCKFDDSFQARRAWKLSSNLHDIYQCRMYQGADKSLARPGRKQATATEDFDVHISYL